MTNMKVTYDNKEIEFVEFPLNDNNLRKISIDVGGSYGEGVWAYFSDEDAVKYDTDFSDTETISIVVLANAPIMFYPDNFWGAFVPVKWMGENRPRCDVEKVDGDISFHSSVLDSPENNLQ